MNEAVALPRPLGRIAGLSPALATVLAGMLVVVLRDGVNHPRPLLTILAAVVLPALVFLLARTLHQLRLLRRELAMLEENRLGILMRIAADGTVVHVTASSLAVLGHPPGALLGPSLVAFCHPEDRPALREILLARPSPRGTIERCLRFRHADGRWLPTELWFGRPEGENRVCVLRDISRRLRTEATLRDSEARFRLLTENAGDMIVRTRADRSRAYVSPASHALLGFTPAEMLGLDFLAMVHPDDRAEVAAGYERFCATGGRTTMSYRLRRKDGAYVAVEAAWVTVPAETGEGNEVVAIVRDVSARKAAEARIAFLARHDPLTGLANRMLFQERAEEALRRVGRGETMAVLCLDLDRFKSVNDTLGHAAGDSLLRAVADRLAACAREVDTVARLGGDEFALLQVGISRAEDSAVLAARLLEVLSGPYEIAGQAVRMGASLGIAIGPVDGTGYETLMQKADVALYRAKAEGRGAWRFYDAAMDAPRLLRQQLELDIGPALDRGEFALHYMPLVALEDGRITGFEALLRWNHPARGTIEPEAFIPVAEETGLILPLGAWALAEACATAAGWPAHVRVAVALSPVQLRSASLLGEVTAALERSGLPPGRLELEIAEAVLRRHDEATLVALAALHRIGVRIAMDDFGSGYSSLRSLQNFPLGRIRLGRSFVRDLATGDGGVAIVRAVAGLGRSLGIETLAEGVETVDQVERLCAEGYDEGQGFHFGRPGGPETIAPLLARHGWRGSPDPPATRDTADCRAVPVA